MRVWAYIGEKELVVLNNMHNNIVNKNNTTYREAASSAIGGVHLMLPSKECEFISTLDVQSIGLQLGSAAPGRSSLFWAML